MLRYFNFNEAKTIPGSEYSKMPSYIPKILHLNYHVSYYRLGETTYSRHPEL
jgi:hypothetical protein